MILRSNDIDTVVLFGIATSGVVLSTLLEAVDNDFRVAVIKDCCADLDSSLHDCLVNKFFSSRGAVLSVRELVQAS
jgi:nicotinamidase-related amidase